MFKLILMLGINIMLILPSAGTNFGNYWVNTLSIFVVSTIYLLTIISTFTDIPADSTIEYNTPVWKQVMFRGMPLILIGIVICCKLMCVLGPDDFKCIKFNMSNSTTTGGKKRKH